MAPAKSPTLATPCCSLVHAARKRGFCRVLGGTGVGWVGEVGGEGGEGGGSGGRKFREPLVNVQWAQRLSYLPAC